LAQAPTGAVPTVSGAAVVAEPLHLAMARTAPSDAGEQRSLLVDFDSQEAAPCLWEGSGTNKGLVDYEENLQLLEELTREDPQRPDFSIEKRGVLLYQAQFAATRASSKVFALQEDSIFSASLAVPMIARSTGYARSFTVTAIKLMCLTLLCIMIQAIVLEKLYRTAMRKMPKLDGQPGMCTYGQDPGSADKAYGPSGVLYDPLEANVEYDFDMYIIRNTLAEMLLHEPFKSKNLTNPRIGPVEYGLESASCRLVCIAVFALGIFQHYQYIAAVVGFLWNSPTTFKPWDLGDRDTEAETERWIECQEDKLLIREDKVTKAIRKAEAAVSNVANKMSNAEVYQPSRTGEEVEAAETIEEMEHTSFKMNGMPWSFKFLWAWPLTMCIRAPLIVAVAYFGLVFLMSTGSIVDLLLNSLALNFLLEVDVLVFTAFGTGMSKDILARMEPFVLEKDAIPGETKANYISMQGTELEYSTFGLLRKIFQGVFPMLALIVVAYGIHFIYFVNNCTMVRPPFSADAFWRTHYFHGQWCAWIFEFIFGAWVSEPRTDYEGGVTCMPYNATTLVAPDGSCGLPSPWHPHHPMPHGHH